MDTHDAGHVDDRAVALAHHDGQAGVDEVEGRLQVDGDDGIPLLFAHAQHQSVLGDAGVVDEDVDASEVFFHLLDHLFRLGEVGSIAGVALGLDAKRFYLSLCLFVDGEVGECDVSPFLGESQRDSFSDTACCTRDECGFSF